MIDTLAAFYGQEFHWHDMATVGLLVVLEGVLSIDNALVLGLLAKRLPKHQQGKALTYGLIGAFLFRLIAIGTATFLLKWRIVKLLGGAYLIYVALKHFIFEREDAPIHHADAQSAMSLIRKGARFWPTVMVIELTDIAFAVDSIVAAIGVVGPAPAGTAADALHPKLWVVLIGGFLGVILMRFAAVVFIKLLDRFPRFEMAAYLLVTTIGLKLVIDWGFNTPDHPHRVDFHSPGNPAFWAFWVAMILCFCIGFLPQRKQTVPRN